MNSNTRLNPATNLLSPDQVSYDTFDQIPSESSDKTSAMFKRSMSIAQILSPPVSPQTKVVLPHDPSIATADPILFANRAASHESDIPLFTAEERDVELLVDAHMSAKALRKKQYRESVQPAKDDYILALSFKSQVYKLWAQDQRKWKARELAYLKADAKMRADYHARKHVPIRPAHATKTTLPTIRRKISTTPKPPKPHRVKEPTRHRGVSEKPHVRQTTTTTREDKDFLALDDFAPPVGSLPPRPNSMKVDWKGTPIDLNNDPHVHLLHPDEVHLAANLRLDCATYLTSKRRVFIGVVQKYREGGEFKKTHCQQSCKIDVNKASKLWEAYKKVDWFNHKYFEKYI